MSVHSMDIDGPKRSESMLMDVTDSAVPCPQLNRHDSVQTNHPGPSDSRMSLDSLPPQRRQISFALWPSVVSCKRKHSDDSLDLRVMPVDHHHIQDDDTSVDSASSQPSRRKRPRQRTRQDGEFSPLLYMSPASPACWQAENIPVDQEASPAFHSSPNTFAPFDAIRRFFHSGSPPEHGPRILLINSTTDLYDDQKERRRSDSANSFAQVALASIASKPDQVHSRLSTLQDLSVPRPFEDTDQPSQTYSSSAHSVPIHERGLDALPSFFVTKAHSGQRADGGALASRGPASSADSASSDALAYGTAMHPLDTSTSASAAGIFLDKPLCESPESMNSDEHGRVHFEFPMVEGNRGRVDAAS